MQSNILYTDEDYKKLRMVSRRSASESVPLVIELIRSQSVMDVVRQGCSKS